MFWCETQKDVYRLRIRILMEKLEKMQLKEITNVNHLKHEFISSNMKKSHLCFSFQVYAKLR